MLDMGQRKKKDTPLGQIATKWGFLPQLHYFIFHIGDLYIFCFIKLLGDLAFILLFFEKRWV
jgi:hypothetical protein